MKNKSMRRMRKNKSRKNMKGGLFGFFENKEEPAPVQGAIPDEPDNRTPEQIKNDYNLECTDGRGTNPALIYVPGKSPSCDTLKAKMDKNAVANWPKPQTLTGDVGGVFNKPSPTANLEQAAKPWYKIWGGRSRRRNRRNRSRRNRKSRRSRK
jgi:hypothetical protein